MLARDVEAAAQAPAAVPAVSVPVDQTARTERVPMSPLRRTIARRLVEAQQTAAMLTTFNEIDMTRVMALRKQYQDRWVKARAKRRMSFFAKP